MYGSAATAGTPPFSVNADSKELSILCFVTLLQVLIPGYLVAARLGAKACDFDCRLLLGGRSFGLCIPNPRYTEKCEVNHRGDWGCANLCVGQMTLRLDPRLTQNKNADGMSARWTKSQYYLLNIIPGITDLSRGIASGRFATGKPQTEGRGIRQSLLHRSLL